MHLQLAGGCVTSISAHVSRRAPQTKKTVASDTQLSACLSSNRHSQQDQISACLSSNRHSQQDQTGSRSHPLILFDMRVQVLASRETPPMGSGVVSIGLMHAGEGAFNVIPDSAMFAGRMRSLDHDHIMHMKARFAEVGSPLQLPATLCSFSAEPEKPGSGRAG